MSHSTNLAIDATAQTTRNDDAAVIAAARDPKAIVYVRSTRDYDASYDGQYIGSFATHHAAEIALDDYALSLLEDGLVDVVPSAVYARPAEPAPEAIEVKSDYEPLTNCQLAAIFADNVLCLPISPITIATETGPKHIDALLLGEWALNENSQGWTITHRKSGYGGKNYETPIEALISLGVFLGAGMLDVPDITPEILKTIPDIHNISARIKAALARLDSWDLDLDYNEREEAHARPAEPVGEPLYACPCGAVEPCKMNTLGTHWTVCGAPADGPCMCDAFVRRLPVGPASIVEIARSSDTSPEPQIASDRQAEWKPGDTAYIDWGWRGTIQQITTNDADGALWAELNNGDATRFAPVAELRRIDADWDHQLQQHALAWRTWPGPDSPSAATPAAHVATNTLLQRRPERDDQPGARAWDCGAGHVFWVAPGVLPLSCPDCAGVASVAQVVYPVAEEEEAQLHTLEALIDAVLVQRIILAKETAYDDALRALTRVVARQKLDSDLLVASSFADAPEAFLSTFDAFTPAQQERATRRCARAWGMEIGEVDQLWVETREKIAASAG